MTELIIPGQAPFAELVNDENELLRVYHHMEDTIWKSFGEDTVRTGKSFRPTESETKRRAAIYVKWFRIMRKDLQYSIFKTLDLLPTALRTEVLGLPFVPPPADQAWAVPGDSRPMVTSPDETFGGGDDGEES